MAETNEMGEIADSPRRRPWIGSIIRLAVVLAALAWLYTQNDWDELRKVLTRADWRLAALGLAAFGPVAVLFGLRLKWLLVVHGIHLSFWRAITVTFVGNFVLNAVPLGTSGGDAVKAWYVARDTPHKHEAVITVFFDRVVGVLGLVLLSGLMVLLNWGNPALAESRRLIGLLLAALLVGGGIYFSHTIRSALRLERIIARLPLAVHLQRIDQAVFAFRHRRNRLAAALILTMGLQVCAVASTFLCGWALNLVGGQPWSAFPVYLAYTPICFLSGALPLGAMEVTYVQLFSHTAGLGPPEAAISLSLLSRLVQILWALPGGLAVLTGQVRLRAPQGSAPSGAELGARA